MNTTARPTRAPAPPPAETQVADRQIEEASFQEVERPNNVPAINRLPDAEMPVSQIMSVRDEAVTSEPIKNVGQLVAGIAGVMAEIDPVEKGGWNKFHHYAFARIQDLLSVLTPLMGKHGIVIFQTEEGRELFDAGKVVAVRYRFTVVHKSGEVWPDRPLQTGLSNCRDTKGGFDDKALNKCHTAARKYFLLSLFQIPTEDMDDADQAAIAEGRQPQRPQGQRRPVPSPDGKLPPHLLPIIQGEAPQAWAKRFKDFIAKAASTAEIDKWYDLNAVVFDKIKNSDVPEVYDDLLDAMDARVAQLGAAVANKPDPISSGSDFPGDRVAKVEDENLAIPAGLRRAPAISDKERDWLLSLEAAFNECPDFESLAEEQRSLMTPAKESVGGQAWNDAVDILNRHIERVNG